MIAPTSMTPASAVPNPSAVPMPPQNQAPVKPAPVPAPVPEAESIIVPAAPAPDGASHGISVDPGFFQIKSRLRAK